MIQCESRDGSVSVCPLPSGSLDGFMNNAVEAEAHCLCHVPLSLSLSNSVDCFELSRRQPWLTTLSPLPVLSRSRHASKEEAGSSDRNILARWSPYSRAFLLPQSMSLGVQDPVYPKPLYKSTS